MKEYCESNTAKAKDLSSKHNLSGLSKREVYKWVCSDKPGKMRLISKEDISIDADYQRDANGDKVLSIARSWSWVACGAIIVGQRDGKLWAIDGQHRVLAAMKRDDITTLPCLVFNTTGQREEAKGFLDVNGNRKPIGAIAKFRASVVAGDETAIYVKHIIEKHSITITGSGGGSPGQIKCVALCMRMASIDRERFVRAFSFTVKLCSEAMFIHERILAAINYIDTHCENGLDDKRLSSRLMDAGPGRLLEGANRASSYFAQGGTAIWAQGFLDVINKGISNRFEFIGKE
jgi:hypothetical protein